MQRWYRYIRVSTEEQKDSYSPEAQIQNTDRQATAAGATIIKTYQDLGLSGKDDNRPELQMMLTDIKRLPKHKRPHAVIVDHTDRLSRNMRDLLNITHEFLVLDIALYTSKGIVDLESDQGIISFQIDGIFAERYLRNLSRETKKGLREKARQGHWVGGISPYGYTRIDKNTIAPSNDASTDLVRLAYSLYQTEGYSLAQLADELNQQAHRWGRTFGVESLRDILQNRAYCGYVSSGGEEFKGKHEPIITEEQWQICAAIRASRTRHRTARHNGSTATTLLIGGLGRCHQCGQALWTSHSGKLVSYYRCAGHSRRNCDLPQQMASKIDEQVLDLICQFSLAVEYHQQALDRLLLLAPEPIPQPDPAQVQAKMDRLSVAWINGNISDEAYQKQLDQLKAQLIAPHEQPQTTVDLMKARQLLASLPDVIQAATLPERRALVRMLFDAIEVSERRVQAIQPKKMYSVLLSAVRYTEKSATVANATSSRRSGKRAFIPTSTSWLSVPLLAGYRQPLIVPSFQ